MPSNSLGLKVHQRPVATATMQLDVEAQQQVVTGTTPPLMLLLVSTLYLGLAVPCAYLFLNTVDADYSSTGARGLTLAIAVVGGVAAVVVDGDVLRKAILGFATGLEAYLVQVALTFAETATAEHAALAYVASAVAIAHFVPFYVVDGYPKSLALLALVGLVLNVLVVLLAAHTDGNRILLLTGVTFAALAAAMKVGDASMRALVLNVVA